MKPRRCNCHAVFVAANGGDDVCHIRMDRAAEPLTMWNGRAVVLRRRPHEAAGCDLINLSYGDLPCCFYRLLSVNTASPSGQPV